jgi:hypothetical protein
MSFEEKRQAALAMLAATGMWRSNYAPPLYRLLWRLGIKVPPPHFASFRSNFAFPGICFGVLWGLLMWLMFWSNQGVPIQRAIILSAVAGVFFGLAMAAFYRHGARKHALPKWQDISAFKDARPST